MSKSRSFKRILGYVKPYWFSLLLNLFFNLVTIFFSLFSFALLVPLLNLLFQTDAIEVVAKPEFALTSDYLMSYLNYAMGTLIVEHGHRYALVFICLVLLVAFLFRNLGRFFAYYTMAKVRIGTNPISCLIRTCQHVDQHLSAASLATVSQLISNCQPIDYLLSAS